MVKTKELISHASRGMIKGYNNTVPAPNSEGNIFEIYPDFNRDTALDIIRKDGRICYLGVYKEPVPIDLLKVQNDNLTIIGSRGEGSHVIERIIPLVVSKKLNFQDMITHKYPLSKINDAFNTFINRIDGALSVIVNP